MRTELSDRAFTFVATKDMDMGTNLRTIKHSGYQYVIGSKELATNRAFSLQMPTCAEYAAPNVHYPILTPIYGREGMGLYHVAPDQLRGADGADLRVTRGT
jgi:hypothetical protein